MKRVPRSLVPAAVAVDLVAAGVVVVAVAAVSEIAGNSYSREYERGCYRQDSSPVLRIVMGRERDAVSEGAGAVS